MGSSLLVLTFFVRRRKFGRTYLNCRDKETVSMKIFVVSVLLLTLASAQDFDEDTVGAIFDGLLADEEIELSGADYDERLAIFSLNYLSGGDIDIDMMFTSDELAKMNGAKMLPTLKSALAEELEKRGESL